MKTIFDAIDNVLGTPFRVALIPSANLNRPGQPHPGQPAYAQNRKLTGGTYEESTVHETANTDPGANAEMHRHFVSELKGGAEGVSFHAVVDDHEIIQLLPLDEVAWHAGDGAYGPGNSTSCATETCVNSDGNWQKTLDNLAKWQAFLLVNAGRTVADVVQHNHWSGKDCPHVLRATGGWAPLLTSITHYVGALTIDQPLLIPPSTHPVSGAFKAFYQARPDALQIWGLPITDAHQEMLGDGNSYLVQYFERARFELHGDHVVQLGLIGDELLAARH